MLCPLRYVFNRNRCCQSNEINLQQLKKMTEEGAILLDVRSPQEFEEGHIEKAISLPEYEIKDNIVQKLPDLSQIIIVYCNTGHRGQKAQRILQKIGYQKVYNLYQGITSHF